MSEITIIDPTLPVDRPFNEPLRAIPGKFGFEQFITSPAELAERRTWQRVNASHAILMSGSPLHYDDNTAEVLAPQLEKLLTTTEVRVLGICLGMQAIAMVFGGQMRRGEAGPAEKENGLGWVVTDEAHRDEPLLAGGLENGFLLWLLHNASISIQNASALERLASSMPTPGVSQFGCENQIIRVHDETVVEPDGQVKIIKRQMFGVQGHPELSERGGGFKLLHNFLHAKSLRAPATEIISPPSDRIIVPAYGLAIPARPAAQLVPGTDAAPLTA